MHVYIICMDWEESDVFVPGIIVLPCDRMYRTTVAPAMHVYMYVNICMDWEESDVFVPGVIALLFGRMYHSMVPVYNIHF
jgi:hypothetical protein